MTEWFATIGGESFGDLIDVTAVDTFNPFGNYAVAVFDDVEGNKFEKITRGLNTQLDVKPINGTKSTRFDGYVVEAREANRAGPDTLEIESYSFDQFLRGDRVSNDQSDKSLSDALKDIIQTDTPVAYNAANVSIGDTQTLTRSFQGDKVENAIQAISSLSENEAFGVNSSLEFFFRARETGRAPRDIAPSEVFDYDIPRRGKEAVNEVEVVYNGGNSIVTVSAGADALQLQDELGTADPVTDSTRVVRDDITDLTDARAVGKQIIQLRNETLTGTVTTFGLYDAKPGDVININIPSRGINDDFEIAEIEYRWATDETILTIVEKRGQQDDLLVRLSDEVDRAQNRVTNEDATRNEVTDTELPCNISISATADLPQGDSATFATRLTNTARNLIRDAWGGDSPVDVDTLRIGNDGSKLNRTNTSLEQPTGTTTVSRRLPDTQTIEYRAEQVDAVSEFGLETAAGELFIRGTLPEPVEIKDISITLGVENDPEDTFAKFTNAGLTAIRDIIIDNNPELPDKYLYGSGTADPQESDTSLGNQQASIPLGVVQEITSQSDWTNAVSTSPTEPITVDSGKLKLQQAAYHYEGEEFTLTSTNSDSDSSEGQFEILSTGKRDDVTRSLEYTIPGDHAKLQMRMRFPKDPDGDGFFEGNGFELRVDGTQVGGLSSSFTTNIGGYRWINPVSGNSTLGFDISGSTTVDINGRATGNGQTDIDLVVIYDDRFSWTFDNSTDSNDALSGPELYPDVETKTLDAGEAIRAVQEATATQSWNDTSKNQFMALSADGGSTFKRSDNTASITKTFSPGSKTILTKVGLSRFGSGNTTTPSSGFEGQEIDTHLLESGKDGRFPSSLGAIETVARLAKGTLSNTQITEGGQESASGTLLTRARFPAIDFSVSNASQIILQASEVGKWQGESISTPTVARYQFTRNRFDPGFNGAIFPKTGSKFGFKRSSLGFGRTAVGFLQNDALGFGQDAPGLAFDTRIVD